MGSFRLAVPAALSMLAAAAFSPSASAQETVLVFATTNAPQAHLNARVHHPWAARINEKGKGIVRVDVRDGPTIANHLNFYQRVLDDVVQIAWGLPLYVSGKFVRSNVTSLPFVVEKAEEASVAYWRLYKSGALDSEFDQIVPLHLVVFPQSGIHLAKPPRSLDNLNGLKIGTGSKMISDLVSRMGGAAISIPLTDYYEGLQRGTIDGTNSQWTQFQPFKLGEVTFYHIDTHLGGAAGMTFMSKRKWDSLPPAVRKILEEESGEAQSRRFGKFWDDVNDEGRKAIQAQPDKHKIVNLTAAQEAAWKEKVTPIVDEWVKSTPDGAKLLEQFTSEIKKVRAGS
jgi:TRAP-type transport system periplasmic protein